MVHCFPNPWKIYQADVLSRLLASSMWDERYYVWMTESRATFFTFKSQEVRSILPQSQVDIDLLMPNCLHFCLVTSTALSANWWKRQRGTVPTQGAKFISYEFVPRLIRLSSILSSQLCQVWTGFRLQSTSRPKCIERTSLLKVIVEQIRWGG